MPAIQTYYLTLSLMEIPNEPVEGDQHVNSGMEIHH
jgi:hypothetical protein